MRKAPQEPQTLRAVLDAVTRIYVTQKLREAGGRPGKAALSLDISRNKLDALCKNLGIPRPFPRKRCEEIQKLWNDGWGPEAIAAEIGYKKKQYVMRVLYDLRRQGRFVRSPKELGSWPLRQPSRFAWVLRYCFSEPNLGEVLGNVAAMLRSFANGWRRAAVGGDPSIRARQILIAQAIEDAAALLEHRAFRDFGRGKQ